MAHKMLSTKRPMKVRADEEFPGKTNLVFDNWCKCSGGRAAETKAAKDERKGTGLHEVNEKILKLEERYMNNEIENSTYQTWFKKFKEEKAALEITMQPKEQRTEQKISLVERVLPSLSNMHKVYHVCNIYQKHAIVRAVFKDNPAWGGGYIYN